MGALPYLAILTSLIAAVLGIRAATIHVRNSQDDFIADLQKQGRWAGWAACAAAVSVALQAVDRLSNRKARQGEPWRDVWVFASNVNGVHGAAGVAWQLIMRMQSQ